MHRTDAKRGGEAYITHVIEQVNNLRLFDQFRFREFFRTVGRAPGLVGSGIAAGNAVIRSNQTVMITVPRC
jgi:hypothetical protein